MWSCDTLSTNSSRGRGSGGPDFHASMMAWRSLKKTGRGVVVKWKCRHEPQVASIINRIWWSISCDFSICVFSPGLWELLNISGWSRKYFGNFLACLWDCWDTDTSLGLVAVSQRSFPPFLVHTSTSPLARTLLTRNVSFTPWPRSFGSIETPPRIRCLVEIQ